MTVPDLAGGGSGGGTFDEFGAGPKAPLQTPATHLARELPEVETFEVVLNKDNQGEWEHKLCRDKIIFHIFVD